MNKNGKKNEINEQNGFYCKNTKRETETKFKFRFSRSVGRLDGCLFIYIYSLNAFTLVHGYVDLSE